MAKKSENPAAAETASRVRNDHANKQINSEITAASLATQSVKGPICDGGESIKPGSAAAVRPTPNPSPSEFTSVRLAMWDNGYKVGPVISAYTEKKGAGKRPLHPDWIKVWGSASPDTVKSWARSSSASNTGILAGRVVAFDVDVMVPEIADKVEALIVQKLGPTLVRTGKPPKRLLPYRFVGDILPKKVMSDVFYFGSAVPENKAQLEVLGDGQQFVVHGIHPGTKQPYIWRDNKSPANTKLEDLPLVRQAQIQQIVAEVNVLLRQSGANEANAGRSPQNKAARAKVTTSLGTETHSTTSIDEFGQAVQRARDALQAGALWGRFGEINNLANSFPETWVQKLVPGAKRRSGGSWRGLCADASPENEFAKRESSKEWSICPDKGNSIFGDAREDGTPQSGYSCTGMLVRLDLYPDAEAAAGAISACFGMSLPPPTEGQRAVAELNEKYAYVTVGDADRILRDKPDGSFTLQRVDSFKRKFGNKFVTSPKTNKPTGVGSHWMQSPDRRDYDELVFDPAAAPSGSGPWGGSYNMWRGFCVEPKSGPIPRLEEFVFEVICRGDQAKANFFWAFFAQIVQQPTIKMGTALILRGAEGTGKSVIGKLFGKYLIGEHHIAVDDPHFIAGHFNAFMATCLVLQADEAFFSGDPRIVGKLKALITEPTHMLERKGIDAVSVPNYTRLICTSNEDWVFPAGFSARRPAFFDVSDARANDRSYFDKIFDEARNGGSAAPVAQAAASGHQRRGLVAGARDARTSVAEGAEHVA